MQNDVVLHCNIWKKKTLNHKVAHCLTDSLSPSSSPDGQTSTGLPALLIYLVVPNFLSPRHDDVVDYISTQIDLPLSRRGDVDCISTLLPTRRRRLRSSRFSRLHFRRISATNTIMSKGGYLLILLPLSLFFFPFL